MAKFVAKPVIKEAIQFQLTENSISTVKNFCGNAFRSIDGFELRHLSYGWVVLNPGDYIVKVKDGFYRTPADVFEANHEPYQE